MIIWQHVCTAGGAYHDGGGGGQEEEEEGQEATGERKACMALESPPYPLRRGHVPPPQIPTSLPLHPLIHGCIIMQREEMDAVEATEENGEGEGEGEGEAARRRKKEKKLAKRLRREEAARAALEEAAQAEVREGGLIGQNGSVDSCRGWFLIVVRWSAQAFGLPGRNRGHDLSSVAVPAACMGRAVVRGQFHEPTRFIDPGCGDVTLQS
jgi:hypothetical protein